MAVLSVTDAVLREYDSGNQSAPRILTTLMYDYPMLTMATINSILHSRRSKSRGKKEKVVPKSPYTEMTESINAQCRDCGYHSTGKPCVMPRSLCPHPQIDDDIIEVKKIWDSNGQEKKIRNLEEANSRKKSRRRRNKNRKLDIDHDEIMDAFDAEVEEYERQQRKSRPKQEPRRRTDIPDLPDDDFHVDDETEYVIDNGDDVEDLTFDDIELMLK